MYGSEVSFPGTLTNDSNSLYVHYSRTLLAITAEQISKWQTNTIIPCVVERGRSSLRVTPKYNKRLLTGVQVELMRPKS